MKYLLFVLIGYLIILIITYLSVERIVFRPTDINQKYNFNFSTSFEEIFLSSPEHDLRINALHFKADNPKGCILYFHGNTGSLDRWGFAHRPFTERGYDTFIIDYPGYGKSNQTSTEELVYVSADLAYAWARARYKPDNIVIYGRSIGSGPASYIASHREAQELILETPFFSMDQILKHYAPFIFNIIPSKVALKVNEHIQGLNMPITIIHGTNDKIVPYSSAVQLKPLLKQSDQFITIEGGGHNNIMEYDMVQDILNQRLIE